MAAPRIWLVKYMIVISPDDILAVTVNLKDQYGSKEKEGSLKAHQKRDS
jgi:hypothetical protein